MELLDPTSSVNILQLAGVKRVASIANVDADFRSSTASLEGISTAASDFGFMIFWFRNHPVIKASSPLFGFLILIGIWIL